MTVDGSFFTYFWHASIIVKLVLLLLISASVVSWTFIFQRHNFFKQVQAAVDDFEEKVWRHQDLTQVYQHLQQHEMAPAGLEYLFKAGFKEFMRLREQPGLEAQEIMEGTERAMRVAYTRETDKLEANLPFLATVGSTSPYVGLFGTVWGIMIAFQGLSHATQATIALVAPGIAEALITTAVGLFAAIPAVIAYNRYASSVERLLSRFDAFKDEFSIFLRRQVDNDRGV